MIFRWIVFVWSLNYYFSLMEDSKYFSYWFGKKYILTKTNEVLPHTNYCNFLYTCQKNMSLENFLKTRQYRYNLKLMAKCSWYVNHGIEIFGQPRGILLICSIIMHWWHNYTVVSCCNLSIWEPHLTRNTFFVVMHFVPLLFCQVKYTTHYYQVWRNIQGVNKLSAFSMP